MASYTGDKSDKVLKKDLIPTILLSNEKKNQDNAVCLYELWTLNFDFSKLEADVQVKKNANNLLTRG